MKVVLEINPPGAVTSTSKLEQVTLSWHNLTVFAKCKKSIYNCYKNDSLPVEIIQNVSGVVMPGQLLAIMGPSGAGKTTLLNSLTGRNLSKMSVTGDVLINGRPVNGRTLASISSYIQQNDMFYPLLTVREHLMFQATLRLGGKMTYAERAELVENVINKLNMVKCGNNRIGSESTFKGISGGEMKRLSFATEILTNPSLIFCDEPTSGLDSFMAESIVRLLKCMASEGRTIVCTIHQPSSQVFALFDHLLLMTNGRIAFMGTRDNAKDFFSSIGHLCSINHNPSDYYMNQLALTSASGSKERVNGICDKFMASEYMTDLLCKIDQSKLHPLQYGIKSPHANEQFGSSPWQQLTTLLMRNYLISIRDTLFIKTESVPILVQALFIGSVYHKQYPISSDVSNINAALFMILLCTSMSAAISSISIFCTEMSIFFREYHNCMYSLGPYLLSKIFIKMLYSCILCVVYVAIVYFMMGLNDEPMAFVICLATSLLSTIASICGGCLISSISSTPEMAMVLFTPFTVIVEMFAGLFINSGELPGWLNWLKYTSFLHYSYETLMVNQWRYIDYIPCLNDSQSMGQCYGNGTNVIISQGFSVSNIYWDPIMLLIFIVLFLILIYIGLVVKIKRAK